MAEHPRSVRDPRRRGHAPADPGRSRRAAIPNWLERWPTSPALAASSAADVIREWQGLGYNRRALALQNAARIVAAGWPADLTELPGVGSYTAAAIRTLPSGTPCSPSTRTSSACSGAPATLLTAVGTGPVRPGREVCVARVPRCDVCPLASKCPSRGLREEPARKQGPFEGSFRERRALTLRLVAKSARELDALDGEAVRSLERDGLVVVEDGVAGLPHLEDWAVDDDRHRLHRHVPAPLSTRTAAAERRTRTSAPPSRSTRRTAQSGV